MLHLCVTILITSALAITATSTHSQVDKPDVTMPSTGSMPTGSVNDSEQNQDSIVTDEETSGDRDASKNISDEISKDEQKREGKTEIPYVPNELIVRLVEGAKPEDLKRDPELGRIFKRYPLRSAEPVIKNPRQLLLASKKFRRRAARAILPRELVPIAKRLSRNVKLTFDDEIVPIKTIQTSMQCSRIIEFVQPNYIYVQNWVPNDEHYQAGDLWNLLIIGMEEAWDKSKGEGIVVAVLDTGVNYTHEDIVDNMWTNEAEKNGTSGQDDDGNGIIDDIYGADFILYDGDPMDELDGHGSFVAGIVAATGNNEKGIIGVAPEAKIMALMVASIFGAPSDAILNGIEYAVNMGADIINMSLGLVDKDEEDWLIHDGISFAVSNGVVTVVAAGNGATDTGYVRPAHYKETISVGATTAQDSMTFYSNFGWLVDLVAPGGEEEMGIKSFAAGMFNEMKLGSDVKYVQQAGGTSAASPHVAGVAALLLAKYPDLNINQLRQALRLSATDLGSPTWDFLSSFGRLNAVEALSKATSACTAYIKKPSPHDLRVAMPGDDELTIEFVVGTPMSVKKQIVSYSLKAGSGIY